MTSPWPLPLIFVSWGFSSGADAWSDADDLAIRCLDAKIFTVAVQLGENEKGELNTVYDDVEKLKDAGLEVVLWGVAGPNQLATDLTRLGLTANEWLPQIEGPGQRDYVLECADDGIVPHAIVTNYSGAGDVPGEAEALRAVGVKCVLVECYNDAGPISPYIELDRMLWQGTAYGWKENELYPVMGTYRGETPDTYSATEEIDRDFGLYLGEPMSTAQWDAFGKLNMDASPAHDWTQEPYPLNPSPPAVQQPRWLYPPDVTGGYEMSDDGPDVRAYKIAVQRLGRWPAPKHQFDQDYSNGFAHGKSDQVGESGIAGIQRQSGLKPTGNLGDGVFKILRTALIPEGLPHAGEPAFTREALDLLNGQKWWAYPFEQGPGPKVDFVRPLYAPDYPGQPAPADGPDVQAVKRAVSRLGRWPWQQFSQTYTDDFAHGTSGNVGDTGVAGVQRQQPGLDDTGNLSAKAFEVLRRALIPPCLPHAHEPALDEKAVQLLKQAAENLQASVREQALEEAVRWLGTKENPAGSNQCTFTDWYGMVGPWCAMFVTYCYELGSPGGSSSFVKGSYYAYVPYIVSDARNTRRGLSVTNSPIPGDLVCYDWAWDGTFDHVGIFESGSASAWKAIEGNTSPDAGGDQSNGGEVCRKSRDKGDASVVFVRVAA